LALPEESLQEFEVNPALARFRNSVNYFYGGFMKKSSIIFVFILALFLYTGSAHARSSILNNFNSAYPSSASGDNAGCQLCHGQSTSTWNEYGWDLRQNGSNFGVLENLPSINANDGTTYLDEIDAGAQPGWTTGANNNLYNSGGLISDTQTPPGGIGALDPPTANQPPTADANGPYTGTAGIPVTLDGSGSSDSDGTIASYSWNFGDGTTGTGVAPSHTYAAAGSYTVSLTVTDDGGATNTDTTSATIDPGIVENLPPTADANGPYTGTAGIPVTLDGSGSSDSDGSIVSYDWDFGDGNTGTGVAPSHAYAAAGSYTVSLTVTDDGGATNTDTTTATIEDDPNYDGNDDGIADSLQDNVASFRTYDGLSYVTLESQPGTSISNYKAVDNPSTADAPSGMEFPYGFFEFTITGVGNGIATTVILPFSVGTTFDTYYKYGPTPDDSTNHWYEFLYDGQTGAEISGNVITLHFVDGMRGDDDLTANGIVVDVGAPAVSDISSGSGTTVSSDGDSSGCFIATAAYGSLLEPHVKILRDFRDRFLLGNTLGKNFVHLYYTYSPPVANFIAKHDSLRATVRVCLLPVVSVSWVALKIGFVSTAALMLILISCFVGLVRFRRRCKEQTTHNKQS